MPKDEKRRARMVVEEVNDTPNILVESVSTNEIQEKVEELQDLTQNIAESVDKSEAIEKEITEAIDDIKPAVEETPQDTVGVDVMPEANIPEEDHYTIQDSPKEEEEFDQVPILKNSNSTNPLVIIIPGIFLLGALLGGIYFYQKGVGPTALPTMTPEPVVTADTTPNPSSSPSATVDLTKFQINVLNGSGIVGEAGRAKSSIETAGFKVSGTANASSYDFTKTIIKAKADVPTDFLAKLSTALSKTYVLDTNQVLSLSSPDSVQVIVGSTKAK